MQAWHAFWKRISKTKGWKRVGSCASICQKAGICFLKRSPVLLSVLPESHRESQMNTKAVSGNRFLRKISQSPALVREIQLPKCIRPACTGWPTSHLLLQAEDDLDSLLQDDELGLGLVALQVDLTHPAQLSEGFVYVANTHSLPGIVS